MKVVQGKKNQAIYHTFIDDADPTQRFTIRHGAPLSEIVDAYSKGYRKEAHNILMNVKAYRKDLYNENGMARDGNSKFQFRVPVTLHCAIERARPGFFNEAKNVREFMEYCHLLTAKG